MTLIATYKENDIPILVGDVLITPSAGDYYELHCKKINKISSNFVVGWTGGQYDGVHIVKNLYKGFEDKKVTKAEVQGFLVNYDVSGFVGPLLLSGWVVDDEGQHPFLWNSEYNTYGIKTISFEKGLNYFKGTGAEFYRGLLKEKPFVNEFESKGVESAKALVLREFTSLMFGEYLAKDMSWRDRFGFGYEALVFDGTQFDYIKDVLYFVLDIHFNEKLEFQKYVEVKPQIQYKNYGHFCVFNKLFGDRIEQYAIGTGYSNIENDVASLNSSNDGFILNNSFIPNSNVFSVGIRYLINNRVIDFATLLTKPEDELVKLQYLNNVIVLSFSTKIINKASVEIRKIISQRNKQS